MPNGHIVRSQSEAALCEHLNQQKFAHDHWPLNFELPIGATEWHIFTPSIVLTGLKCDDRIVIVEPIDSIQIGGGVRRLQSFHKRHGREYYTIIVTRRALHHRVPSDAYDSIFDIEALSELGDFLREQGKPGLPLTRLNFLALGDSYTIGEAVAPSERWPAQLVALLRAEGVAINDPLIIATTGWTTDELSAGIDQANPPRTYDLVSLLIGVNNQYRAQAAGEYRTQFAALLQRAIGFAGGEPARVLVLSIPDWGVTPFAAQAGRDRAAIAAEIDAFNAINQEETINAGARYVDVTPISRAAVNDPALIAGDGLHPSGKMYAEWARLATPTALKIIGIG